jgi:hypothetical protein
MLGMAQPLAQTGAGLLFLFGWAACLEPEERAGAGSAAAAGADRGSGIGGTAADGASTGAAAGAMSSEVPFPGLTVGDPIWFDSSVEVAVVSRSEFIWPSVSTSSSCRRYPRAVLTAQQLQLLSAARLVERAHSLTLDGCSSSGVRIVDADGTFEDYAEFDSCPPSEGSFVGIPADFTLSFPWEQGYDCTACVEAADCSGVCEAGFCEDGGG